MDPARHGPAGAVRRLDREASQDLRGQPNSLLPYSGFCVAIETRLSRSKHEVKDGPVIDRVEK